jgi:hypothetical protein
MSTTLFTPSCADFATTQRTALEAREAGRYLAERLGLQEPISRFAMWKYARLGEIPHKRLSRHVWFLTDELDEFARRDGSRKKSE